MNGLVDIIITGLIIGGIYALIAVGLSLQYGVGRVLNVSHGEFILVGALSTYSLYRDFGISPLLAIVIITPVLFIIGFWTRPDLIQFHPQDFGHAEAFCRAVLLASFGLLFIVQNLMLFTWGAESKAIPTSIPRFRSSAACMVSTACLPWEWQWGQRHLLCVHQKHTAWQSHPRGG